MSSCKCSSPRLSLFFDDDRTEVPVDPSKGLVSEIRERKLLGGKKFFDSRIKFFDALLSLQVVK